MPRKPWLSASGDTYFKQRMRALVRDNFTCQFTNARLFIPDARLYDPTLYQRAMGEWIGIRFSELPGICSVDCPEDRLNVLQVHHIIERTNFTLYQIEGHDLSNLITVCKGHHAQIHPHIRYELAAPIIERNGVKRSL